jgi:hypothetical protein
MTGVTIELNTPGVGELSDAVRGLREWQHNASPMQLHAGDLGWFSQFGAEATALAIRTWSRDRVQQWGGSPASCGTPWRADCRTPTRGLCSRTTAKASRWQR